MKIPEIKTKALGLMDAIDTDLVNSGIDSNTLNAIGQLRKFLELLSDEPKSDQPKNIDEVITRLLFVAVNHLVGGTPSDFDEIMSGLKYNFKQIFTDWF